MASIFVSYARESEAAVQSLAADVESLDHQVWVDHDLKGGREWWDQILAHIRDCHVFMMTLSPESLSSAACKREYSYAAELGKPILPILIAEGVSLQTLPARLSQIQYVDYRKRDVASALKLANALSAVPPAGALPDPLPAPPGAPLSYLGGIAEQIDGDKPLDDKEQTVLVSSLRRALRDAETEADARALLIRLRARRGLFAEIRDEIDELLEKQPKAPHAVPDRPDAGPARDDADAGARAAETLVAETFGETLPRSAAASDTAPRASERVRYAGYGFFIGAALGALSGFLGFGGGVVPMAALAVGGAVTGAISAKRLHVVRVAVAGGVLGAIAVMIFANVVGEGRNAWPMGVTLGIPPGMIAGACLGALIARKRRAA